MKNAWACSFRRRPLLESIVTLYMVDLIHVCILNSTFYAVLMHDTIYSFQLLFKECANIEFDKLGSENSQFFRQYIKEKNIWNSKVYQSERCQKWPKSLSQNDLNLPSHRPFEKNVNLEFIVKSKEFEFGSNEFSVAHRVSCQPHLRHQVEYDSNCLCNPTCSLLAKEFWRSQHGYLN